MPHTELQTREFPLEVVLTACSTFSLTDDPNAAKDFLVFVSRNEAIDNIAVPRATAEIFDVLSKKHPWFEGVMHEVLEQAKKTAAIYKAEQTTRLKRDDPAMKKYYDILRERLPEWKEKYGATISVTQMNEDEHPTMTLEEENSILKQAMISEILNKIISMALGPQSPKPQTTPPTLH